MASAPGARHAQRVRLPQWWWPGGGAPSPCGRSGARRRERAGAVLQSRFAYHVIFEAGAQGFSASRAWQQGLPLAALPCCRRPASRAAAGRWPSATAVYGRGRQPMSGQSYTEAKGCGGASGHDHPPISREAAPQRLPDTPTLLQSAATAKGAKSGTAAAATSATKRKRRERSRPSVPVARERQRRKVRLTLNSVILNLQG